MISPISTTDQYILQPTLLDKHKRTLDWLSASLLWKRELTFFQTILDQYAPRFTAEADKKKTDHFQNIVIYYRGEVVDTLAGKLRAHEQHLARMLETKNETDLEYFREHDALMAEMDAFQCQFAQYKLELFDFVEKVM